jgi:hypothetical protein
MKKMRWILGFVGICIVAFATGIVAGFVKNGICDMTKATNEPVTEGAIKVMEEEETVEYAPKKLDHYLVESDGSYITLAEVFVDESKNVVEIMQFNTSVLPKADIMLLEEGMVFEEKDEALLMIENFVS